MSTSKFDPDQRQKHEFDMMQSICLKPWETAVEPVQVAPHVYYAGNVWVGVFWLVTEDGIVLFDTGLPSQVEVIFESMFKKGFNPQNIKTVLISHAHFDHCGGLKGVLEYTGAESFCSIEDAKAFCGSPDKLLSFDMDYQAIVPKSRYNVGERIVCGSFSIEPVVIGGHTEGTTCFFFEDRDEKGVIYRIGIHGGLGLSMLQDRYFTSVEEAVLERNKYRKAQAMVYNRRVDIPLSFHQYNLDTVKKALNGWQALVEPKAWRSMIDSRLKALDDLEEDSIYIRR